MQNCRNKRYLDPAPARISHDIDNWTETARTGVSSETSSFDKIIVFATGFYGRNSSYVK